MPGKSWWAAENVKKGTFRNISNGLSIRKPDLMHKGLLEHAKTKKWVKEDATEETFDWKLVMTGSSEKENELEPSGREKQGLNLLDTNYSKLLLNCETRNLSSTMNSAFDGMVNVLRDDTICMQGSFQTTGSQISLLSSEQNLLRDIHFFTSYNPSISIYKPFVFPTTTSSDKESISKLLEMNEKSKGLWSLYHKLNRRDKKSIKETLIKKETEIVNSIFNLPLNEESLKNRNLYEEYLDQESQIVKM